MAPSTEEKRRRLKQALERGVAMVHLDARQPGVQVPSRFQADHHLRLNLSLNFDPPDLTLNDWGVRETLNFERVPFEVAVPWQAIFAITGNARTEQAWLFPEDMPRELFEAAAQHFGLSGEELEQLREEASQTPVLDLKPADPAPRRFVPRVVAEEPDAAPETEPRARRSHLRLIKS
jgi:stringent starvation protein B